VKQTIAFIMLFFYSLIIFGQNNSQNLRGTIIDKQSQSVLENVKVTLLTYETEKELPHLKNG
jgi:hypothetical protein